MRREASASLEVRRVPNVGGSADLGSELLDVSRRSSLNVLSDERPIISPTVPGVTDAKRRGSESDQFDRQDRTNSHQVKDDRSRPIKGPKPKYVQKELSKILNLEYSGSEVLHIKHVYNQIDYRDRGYVFRHDVERYYAQAIAGHLYLTSNETLTEIVSSCDTNRDGKHLRCDIFVLSSIFSFSRQR